MKRFLLTSIFIMFACAANAQFHFGGQFSINFGNERTSYSSGFSTNKENAYLISLNPKLYWNLNEKMQLGGRAGFAFGRIATGTIYDTEKKEDATIVNRAIGWSVAPFFGYKLLNWKIVGIWAEANVFFGQYYNTDTHKLLINEWGTASEYGFQILPVINIDLTEKLALQLHLGFISLGWYGTTAIYDDRVTTSSTWDLHKGGFAGLMQGFADYGIGLVRKF